VSFGSGTTGRGANLIFLDWVGLESSSEGRAVALRAGELGRDLEGLRGDGPMGDGLRRIDCRAMVFDQGRRRTGRRRRRWTYGLGA